MHVYKLGFISGEKGERVPADPAKPPHVKEPPPQDDTNNNVNNNNNNKAEPPDPGKQDKPVAKSPQSPQGLCACYL